jgi:DNA-binding NarL/FixJ family response regulator
VRVALNAERTFVVQDRSRLYRESLQILLRTVRGIGIVEAVSDNENVVAACLESRVEAVLLESDAVPWDVADLVHRIQALDGPIGIVATVCTHDTRRRKIEGVAYVDRGAPSMVLAGLLTSKDQKNGLPRTGLRSDEPTSYAERLTRRELQVLAMITGGSTTAQIAERLGISGKTVESKRQALFTKLGVQNQAAAVAVAVRSGLLGATPARPEPVSPP